MKKIMSILSKLFLVLVILLPAVLFQLASQTELVANIIHFVENYLVLYLVSLTVLKAFSIIYPPLPGVALTIVSIPIIGWEKAYIVDICGSGIGAAVSYYLGKKYGYSLLNHVVGKGIAEKVRNIKLKEKNQVEAAIFLRFASGGMISDGLAWGASLIGFRFITFITGYLISHIATTLPVFYLISASISFDSWVLVACAAILAWFVIYKFKGRYFE